MILRRILTPDPISLPPEAEVTEAMNLMDEHGFRHLPVMSGQRLVGVVSNRDLLEATGWKKNGVWIARPGRALTLGVIMQTSPVTLSPSDDVVSAASEMSLGRIGCLPVIEHGVLVGIVTETDLARTYVHGCNSGALVDPRVEELMTGNTMTVQAETSLEEAAALCRSTGVRHLPVLIGERLVGILSDRALRRAHGSQLPDETLVSRLMSSDPVIVGPRQSVSVATKRLLDLKISALPVVIGDRLVGILTLTDVLEYCMSALRALEPVERT